MDNELFKDVDEGHFDGETPIHYYYNREERIQRAPQIVKDYYDGKLNPKRGLKAIFEKPVNRFTFFALVFFVGFVWIYNGLINTKNITKINDIPFELTSVCINETVYSTVKIKENKKNINPQKIFVYVLYINSDNIVQDKYELSCIYSGKEESLHTKAFDFELIRVEAVIKVGDEEKEIFTSIKR